MRIRMLHPEFFSDATLAGLSDLTRLVFIGLWLLADREGRLADNPKMIDGALLALDKRSSTRALHELAACGRIVRYPTPLGPVIQVVNFKKYQHVHPKEKPSQFPGPANGQASGSASGADTDAVGKSNRPDRGTSTSTSTSTSRAEGAPSARAAAREVRSTEGSGSAAADGRAKRAASASSRRGKETLSDEHRAMLRKAGF